MTSDQFITMAIPFDQQLHGWDLFRLVVYSKAMVGDTDTHLTDDDHLPQNIINIFRDCDKR